MLRANNVAKQRDANMPLQPRERVQRNDKYSKKEELLQNFVKCAERLTNQLNVKIRGRPR